jgi:hypothetical protein
MESQPVAFYRYGLHICFLCLEISSFIIYHVQHEYNDQMNNFIVIKLIQNMMGLLAFSLISKVFERNFYK